MPEQPEPALPGRKREARANDTAILHAARAVFAGGNQDASMADVARRAGVGVGSIYRRYPTREALIAALHTHGVREAARLAHDVAEERSGPQGAVVAFVGRQIATATGPLLRPVGAVTPWPEGLAEATADLHRGLERLVALDLETGRVPRGFTAADVMQLLLHLRPILPLPRERADALHRRYLDLVAVGLAERAAAGDELTDGPTWDEWVGVWYDESRH